jgi:hypothetical protein
MPYRRQEAEERRLTNGDRGRPRDARWRLELLLDVDESWGKRSKPEWGLAMPKESANGWVAQRLADDERVAVLTSVRGKKMAKGKIFLASASFYRRRRERGSGWAPQVGDRCGPWLVFLNVARASLVNRCTVLNPTRYQTVFIFSKMNQVVNWKNHSKNYEILHAYRF